MQTMNPMLRSLTRAAATAAMIVLAGGWSLAVSAQAIDRKSVV